MKGVQKHQRAHFIVKPKITFGICAAFVLLILAVLSPVLQVYWPLGVAATRESIATWSYGLAQIAFGLVAAFVIFLLPQVVEVGRLHWRWNLTRLYYSETDTFDRKAAFHDFRTALEFYATLPGRLVSDRVQKWLSEQQSRSSQQSMSSHEVESSLNLLSQELKDCIGSQEKWSLMVEKTATAFTNPWSSSDQMRRWLFAAYSTETLQSTHRTLIVLLLALIGTSVLFGSLALAPDPFLYHFLTQRLTGRVLFRSEENYPELSMWITACSYLANIFFLALLFAVETLSTHVHDPRQFDEKIP